MSRPERISLGGMAYHVINRASFRSTLFSNEKAYQQFIDILKEAKELTSMRILSYCLMPNHWHLVLYPKIRAKRRD